MWIPTEHEKYGVGKFNACIIIIFVIIMLFLMCARGTFGVLLEVICTRAFLIVISQSWTRRAEQSRAPFISFIRRSDSRSSSDGHIAPHRLVAVTPHRLPNEQPHFDYFHTVPHHLPSPPLLLVLCPISHRGVRGGGRVCSRGTRGCVRRHFRAR